MRGQGWVGRFCHFGLCRKLTKVIAIAKIEGEVEEDIFIEVERDVF